MVAVAPAIARHPEGTVSEVTVCCVLQRYQALVSVGVGEPAQVPFVEVKVEPDAAVPVIAGATLFTTTAALAGRSGPDTAKVKPARTANAKPTSLFAPTPLNLPCEKAKNHRR